MFGKYGWRVEKRSGSGHNGFAAARLPGIRSVYFYGSASKEKMFRRSEYGNTGVLKSSAIFFAVLVAAVACFAAAFLYTDWRQNLARTEILRDIAGGESTDIRTRYERNAEYYHSLKTILWIAFAGLLALACGIFLKSLRGAADALRDMRINLQMVALKNWTAPDLAPSEFVELSDFARVINETKHILREHIVRLNETAALERQLAHERMENERKERLLVETQMASLKSQINPHFLFNTLDLVGKTALLDDPGHAMELIEAIGKILRYSLRTTNTPVTVREELDIVETYLYLQKSRFGDALSYSVSIDDDLRDFPIQSMLIQPIVENSFKHGFAGDGPLRLDISVRAAGQAVEFAVRDDGEGFDVADLESHARRENIGLANIRKRLELAYGNAAVVRIESEIGSHTRVVVTIPAFTGGKI